VSRSIKLSIGIAVSLVCVWLSMRDVAPLRGRRRTPPGELLGLRGQHGAHARGFLDPRGALALADLEPARLTTGSLFSPR